jgi:MFS family permease
VAKCDRLTRTLTDGGQASRLVARSGTILPSSGRPLALASASLFVFATTVVLEHLLQPSLSPSTHQISEYANDPSVGWVMTVGFVAWALSLGVSALCVQAVGRSVALIATTCLLLVASAGMVLTAAFHTETVAGAIPFGHHLTTSGRLHDLGSGVTTLAILAAAIVSAWALVHRLWFVRFVWACVLLAVTSDVGLLLVGPSVGGVRERVLVAVGCLWQAVFLGVIAEHIRRA